MTSFASLEGEVLLIKFTEIHGLDPGRNPFAGVVTEPHTALVIAQDAPLRTEYGTVVQFCTEGTVSAGFFNFFPEQHMVHLISHNN